MLPARCSLSARRYVNTLLAAVHVPSPERRGDPLAFEVGPKAGDEHEESAEQYPRPQPEIGRRSPRAQRAKPAPPLGKTSAAALSTPTETVAPAASKTMAETAPSQKTAADTAPSEPG